MTSDKHFKFVAKMVCIHCKDVCLIPVTVSVAAPLTLNCVFPWRCGPVTAARCRAVSTDARWRVSVSVGYHGGRGCRHRGRRKPLVEILRRQPRLLAAN